MDIVFLINTYNRQESCQRLVDSLHGKGDIVVVNDGCGYIINGCRQHFLDQHNGKAYYWMTVKTLFALRGNHKYYFMLPDDFLPTENMIDNAIAIWMSIYDPQKICLNLLADRGGCVCWTGFTPKDMGNVWQTQWVDMCFMCEERFFGIIDLNGMTNSFAGRGNMSSGVGAMISRRLHNKGFNLYQVKQSLVSPQESHGKSQMHDPSHVVNRETNKRAVGRRQRIVFDTRKFRGR